MSLREHVANTSEYILTCVREASPQHLNLLWKRDIIDLMRMTGVPHLRVQLVAVHPVDVTLGSPAKEVSEIPCEGEGGNGPPDLRPLLNLHCLDRDLGDGPEAGTDNQVPVWQEAKRLYSHLEELPDWGHSLINCALDVNLDHVSSGRTAVDEFVNGVDDHGGELALQVTEIYFQAFNLHDKQRVLNSLLTFLCF